MKTFYITTPIYYVNDVPHLGHAYTSIMADILARFKRLDGYDVRFLTGTDEHGQKIEKTAIAKGLAPKDLVDQTSISFRELSELLNLSNDDFIRTSEDRHKSYVQEIWKKLVENGSIYLGKYSGWYAVRDEAFYAESELVNGKAPTGADVEWLEEPSYFFKLSAFENKLLKLYADNPEFIAPEVKSGLQDLSVSRTSFTWGIPVPGDEKHVIYVWLDALFNYLSAIGGVSSKYWPCSIHLVGKDILRFHTVYWPAFLMALDIELPKRVFAHGWWTVEGEKMSKSIGNVIAPSAIVSEFGLDYFRYFVARELPFGNDGNFSREAFINRINAELANNIGNLVQRVLSFVNKNCDSKVPSNQNLNPEDRDLLVAAYEVIEKVRNDIDKQAIHTAFEHVIRLGSLANEYIDKNAPWTLRKTDVSRMNAVLYTLLETIRCISIMLQPIVPESAAKFLGLLNVSDISFKTLNSEAALKPGEDLKIAEIVFARIGL
jgi:methionyl-tRNA synthetase